MILSAAWLSLTGVSQRTPRFDVVSVRAYPPGTRLRHPPGWPGPILPGGAFHDPEVTVAQLVEDAYPGSTLGVTLQGLPEWARRDVFDVSAKANAGHAAGADAEAENEAAVREMLQPVLAERFGLKFHFENRTLDFLALTCNGCGEYLKRVKPGVEAHHSGVGLGPTNIVIEENEERMSDFTGLLEFVLRKPVVDNTGMEGYYDFRVIKQFPDTGERSGEDYTGSLKDVMRDSLGLVFKSEKGPVRIMVVDLVHRPTPN